MAKPAGRVSAGIVLFRRRGGVLEVLLGHPGGPYFARKDEGHWSIPKGEVDDGEDDLRLVALREFEEETGQSIGVAPEALLELGDIVQKGGKRVVAWAAEGDVDRIDAVIALAREQAEAVDGRPNHALSSDRAAQRGTTPLYRSLVSTAEAKRAQVKAEIVREHHQ